MDESRGLLALGYAARRHRAGFSAIISLDTALARSVSAASDPFHGQVRLAWWRDQLNALEANRVANDPVLMSLQPIISSLRPASIRLVNAWETLFDPWPMTIGSAEHHAHERGEAVFTMAAQLAEVPFDTEIARAARLWALADLALHCSDPDIAAGLMGVAGSYVGLAKKVPRDLLPFGILTRFAERDVQRGISNRIATGSLRHIGEAFGLFLGFN